MQNQIRRLHRSSLTKKENTVNNPQCVGGGGVHSFFLHLYLTDGVLNAVELQDFF